MSMTKSLVIVESPAKAKTIEKYLGKGFEVRASIGHIMDLPKNEIGVELEKRTFVPELVEYLTLDALLHPEKQSEKSFKARFVGIDGEPARVSNGTDKDGKAQWISNALAGKAAMDETLAALNDAKWSLTSVQATEKQRRPLPPFITSQLQRDASSKLGFNVRRTMGVAQRLYEGVDVGAEGTVGLITYMRTDSPRVAPEAITGAREWVTKQLGAKYLPAAPNTYKGKKAAQDAHEAIRPTDVSRTPESIARYLSDEQLKLYRLIWQRFVASQMVPAVYDVTTATIAAKSAKTGKTYDFRVSGSVLRFDGFLKVYEVAEEKKDEDDETANRLPNLDNVKRLDLEELIHQQRFTEPP